MNNTQSPGWRYSNSGSPSHKQNSFNQSHGQNSSFNASLPNSNQNNNTSFNNSMSPNTSGAFSSSFKKYANKNEFIMDTKGLQQYLK